MYAGSPVCIVHIDVSLTQFKVKVKVTRRWPSAPFRGLLFCFFAMALRPSTIASVVVLVQLLPVYHTERPPMFTTLCMWCKASLVLSVTAETGLSCWCMEASDVLVLKNNYGFYCYHNSSFYHTAQCYHGILSVCLSIHLSVCLSVCQSQVGVLAEWLNMLSRKQCHMIVLEL